MPNTAPQVDPRGLRFAAGLTSLVLIVAIVSESAIVVALQAAVFAVAVVGGLGRSPYGLLFKYLVRPRIGPPAETEDARPPRFAQGVGLGFALVALVALLVGLNTLALVALGFALVAAVLNAVFGLCLGCEVYLLINRFVSPRDQDARGGLKTTTEVSA